MATKGSERRRKTAPDSGLVLTGGGRPKMRKASKRNWTIAKEQAYVETLAATCNLTAAAAAARVSVSGARERRKTHARFRASCAEAIAFAYQRLELAMLERSLNGTEKIITRKDGSEERVREYSPAVAMTLLRMHRETAQEVINEPDEPDIEQVRERLFQKLQRLRKRIESEESGKEQPGTKE